MHISSDLSALRHLSCKQTMVNALGDILWCQHGTTPTQKKKSLKAVKINVIVFGITTEYPKSSSLEILGCHFLVMLFKMELCSTLSCDKRLQNFPFRLLITRLEKNNLWKLSQFSSVYCRDVQVRIDDKHRENNQCQAGKIALQKIYLSTNTTASCLGK